MSSNSPTEAQLLKLAIAALMAHTCPPEDFEQEFAKTLSRRLYLEVGHRRWVDGVDLFEASLYGWRLNHKRASNQ